MSAYSGSGWRGPLVRYVVAATLVRGADGGAAVGIVLLALAHDPHGAGGAGLLAAALTAPHLLGPWLARELDGARDGRVVLAAAFTVYGAALAVAVLLLGRVPLAGVVAAVAVAGACGPLLTGGLSSRLADVTRSSGARGEGGDAGGLSSRPADVTGSSVTRAEGWDAVTYGVAGTAGPAAVAALAALATPTVAMLALAVAAVAAAPVTLTLPRSGPSRRAAPAALPVRGTLLTMARFGPLRRVTVATLLTALGIGGLSVIAAVLGPSLSSRPGAGATLMAAFGLGNLAGSLLVTAFPLRGEPDRLTGRSVALMAVTLGLCAPAPSYPLALAAFALAGAANAPYFTATLAARSRYAPSGARAQVFVSLAGAKVAMMSAGAALAGAAIGLGPRTLLAAGAAITATAAAATVIDRRLDAGLDLLHRRRRTPMEGRLSASPSSD